MNRLSDRKHRNQAHRFYKIMQKSYRNSSVISGDAKVYRKFYSKVLGF